MEMCRKDFRATIFMIFDKVQRRNSETIEWNRLLAMKHLLRKIFTTSLKNFPIVAQWGKIEIMRPKIKKSTFFFPIETNSTLFKTLCRFEYV